MGDGAALAELRRRLGVPAARERVAASTVGARFLPLIDRMMAWPEAFYFADELYEEFGYPTPLEMKRAFHATAGLHLSLFAHRARIDHTLILLATTDTPAAQIVYFWRSAARPEHLSTFDAEDPLRAPGLQEASRALDEAMREDMGIGLGEVMRALRPSEGYLGE